ncbi:hypothetical protein [Citrobacter werkmanii]|uniref:hypothetical protein n=1 Tax=Citrobacter werkmanii TaxID=67827 RepID=UPI0037CA3BEE
MSKYRKGAVYLRHLRRTDKSTSFQISLRLAYFSNPSLWKHPEGVKPVVMVRHGSNNVMEIFMNREEALRSLYITRTIRQRNRKHNPKRGLRQTRGDLRKGFRAWVSKYAKKEDKANAS